jgi:hypothetical protein
MIQFRSRSFMPVNPKHLHLHPSAIIGGNANGNECAEVNEMLSVGVGAGGGEEEGSLESPSLSRRISVHRRNLSGMARKEGIAYLVRAKIMSASQESSLVHLQ